MKFPIGPETPGEWQLAHALAVELTIEGFDSTLALPVVIHLMAIIDAGHDDPFKAIEKLKESRKKDDEWWVKHWPRKKFAKAAKKRLEMGNEFWRINKVE